MMRVRPEEIHHDPAAVVHERQELLRQEEHALEVDMVKAVQLRLSGLIEGGVVRGAGIVDEVVEALRAQIRQRLAHTLDERIESAGFAGVELQGDGLPPRPRRQADDLARFCLVGVVGKDRIDAALRELWGALHIWRNVEFFDMWSTAADRGF